MCGLLIALSYSSAMFEKRKEINTINIVVGDLSYQLTGNYLNDQREVTIEAGSKKQINLTLSSFNEIDSKYALYYNFITELTEEEKKQVEVGYLSTTVNPTSGEIAQQESLSIAIKIVNNLSKDITLIIGADGGLIHNELEVTSGYAIDHVMYGSDIILAATLDGTPLETFPTQADNYGVESVSCTDNAVGTFKTSNWSFIVEDFTRNETECTVNFSKNLTIEETSPIITSTKEEMNQEIIDAKSSLATAITNMGVATASTDSFATMATNIGLISDDATAVAGNILSGKTAYVGGTLITGTMTNQGAVTSTLSAGGSYTIPAGYHNGSGKITASSLSSQTSATATAAQILSGQTAWVNGTKITGTMTNRGAVTSTLNAGGSYTIPAGYHNGSGKVTVNTLASQTSATATAADIATGKTAWVNGVKLTGTLLASTKLSLGTATSIDVKSKYAGYASLTKDNFIMQITSVTVEGNNYRSLNTANGNAASGTITPTLTYTASTGTVTISGLSATFNHTEGSTNYLWVKGTIAVNVWLIV